MKKIISAVLVLTMMLALLSGCGDNSASENNVETSDLYEQVMARFDGELEEGAVIKVLENDTAVEWGYVDQLINAFNEAYKDKGISAERMNIDQYSDLATDGPYGYGPDVWYQANDILMKYADNQHLLPLPIYDMECYEQIPQNAWNAYATDINGETFYCGIPLNVCSTISNPCSRKTGKQSGISIAMAPLIFLRPILRFMHIPSCVKRAAKKQSMVIWTKPWTPTL